MIVHDSWWSNGSARSTIIDYHELFDQGFTKGLRHDLGPFTRAGHFHLQN